MKHEALDFLVTVQLFNGLSVDQLENIADCSDVVWFDSGEAVTQAEEPGASAFLVVEGSVTVSDAAAPAGFDQPMGPGTLIGELAMLTEVCYAATVIAAEPVRALAITREALHQVMEADPSIAEHCSAKLVRRLSSLADDLRAVDDRFESLQMSLERSAEAA
jgi:CRP-like cAMP-binding protein